MKTGKIKKTAYLGLMTAVAVLCGYVEYLLPVNLGIPGIKLGLCNFVILIVLYSAGVREALMVSAVRILINGFLFGSMFSMLYGLSGALLSLAVMAVLKKSGLFSMIGVSAAGGAVHNIGQLLMAYILTPALPLLWYLPVLMLAGLGTGILIGILSLLIWKRTKPLYRKMVCGQLE